MNENFENLNDIEEQASPAEDVGAANDTPPAGEELIAETSANEEPCENTADGQFIPEEPDKTGSYGGFSNKWAWDRYEEKNRKKGKGLKIFAGIMCALFLVTLTSFMTYYFVDKHFDAIKDLRYTGDLQANTTPDENKKDTPTLNENIKDEITKAPEREEEEVSAEYTGDVLTRQQIITLAGPSVVGIKTQVQGYSYFGGTSVYEGVGSGFVLTETGYIVTNYHVIEDAMAIKVILENANEYEAELIGSDELSDIAVLKIEPDEKLEPVVIGNSDSVVAGDSVIAIGCPAGIEFAGTATSGMVSRASREVAITDSYGRVQKTMYAIQIDAPINPGNSGGPLLNDRGEVIGINTLKLSTGYEGIGFAVPINGVMDIVDQLCENGVVVDRGESSYVKGKAALGITYNELTEQESRYYQVPRGVLVILATPGGAAQEYGIKGGDIIVAFNDTEITTADELIACLDKSAPGDEVTIKVWRDGEEKKIPVVLGESS